MLSGQYALAIILSMLVHTLAWAKLDHNVHNKLQSLVGTEFSYIFKDYTDTPETNFFLNHLVSVENELAPIEREESTEYKKLRQSYLAQAIQKQFHLERPYQERTPATIVNKSKLKFKNPPQYLGLIVFKKDEMQERCQKVVERAVHIGAQGIAFYYPVHYSGGNSKKYKMPPDPIYNKHYRYEFAQLPIQKHIEDCIDLIIKNKLKLSYVPHLESIALLEDANIEEWRMYSGIPLNEHYYQAAFGPLMKYIAKNPNHKLNHKNLSLTLAAEIDTMVITRPEDTLGVLEKIHSQLNRNKLKDIPIYLNTNGDFYHAWDLPQIPQKISCDKMAMLFKKINYFAPSMYGDKGHFVIDQNKINIEKTIHRYYTNFNNKMQQLCPKNKIDLSKIPIGFGEFALDLNDTRQKYDDVLNHSKKIKFIQYWNHSKWDHLGVLADYQVNSQLLYKPSKPTKVRKPSNKEK